MRKYTALLLFLFSSVMFLSSCIEVLNNSVTGNGNVVTEKRSIGSFDAIEAATGLNVIVQFGEASGDIEVVADENLQEYIRTEVDGGLLKIRSERSIRNAKSKDIYVNSGSLKEIRVSSAAHLKGENKLTTDRLQIDVSSAADLDLDFDAQSVDVNVSSSGKANLSGKAEEMKAQVSSAGHLNADELQTINCDVDASSAGDMNIHVTGELSASASSAGSIHYKGDPEIRRQESSSAGHISHK